VRSERSFVNVTNVLIAINVAAFVWETLTGTKGDDASLIAHGALWGPLVRQGQWWRIVSGAFLHDGFWHIALNMWALYQLGMFVEITLGGPRMLAIYTFSLLTSGLAVVYFAPNDVTVGASGAIFGLFGGIIAIGLRVGGARGRSLIMQTFPILVINLIFTFAVPFISRAGHLGGLAGGFVATLVLFAMRPPRPEPVAVDVATGEESAAEYLPPETAQRSS